MWLRRWWKIFCVIGYSCKSNRYSSETLLAIPGKQQNFAGARPANNSGINASRMERHNELPMLWPGTLGAFGHRFEIDTLCFCSWFLTTCYGNFGMSWSSRGPQLKPGSLEGWLQRNGSSSTFDRSGRHCCLCCATFEIPVAQLMVDMERYG